MSNETTKAGKMGEWARLLAAATANQDDLAELETSRARLETVLGQVEQLAGRQAAHAVGKQEATKLLKEAMAECQRVATYLRHGLSLSSGVRLSGPPGVQGRMRKLPTNSRMTFPQPATDSRASGTSPAASPMRAMLQFPTHNSPQT